MGCGLRIAGRQLDIDDFISKSGLEGFHKMKGNSESAQLGKRYSWISTLIVEDCLDDPKKQISEAILYLNKNMRKLDLVRSTKEIEFATLDFMIAKKSVSEEYFAQYIYFPKELTVLCGKLEIGIEVTIV